MRDKRRARAQTVARGRRRHSERARAVEARKRAEAREAWQRKVARESEERELQERADHAAYAPLMEAGDHRALAAAGWVRIRPPWPKRVILKARGRWAARRSRSVADAVR